MMTWTTSLLVLVLALATVLAPAAAARDAVADSCDAIRDFVDPGFCASRLRSVPGAASAHDRRAHLLAAAGLAAAAGASAAATATAAREAADRGPAAARDALEACGLLYGAGSVPALRLLRGYAAARSWAAARALLPLTGQAGIGCDAALAGAPEPAGSVAAANREFDQLTTMTTALLNAVAS